MMVQLDEKVASQQGFPPKVPVPREHFEGLADRGLKADELREWIKDFLVNSEFGQNATWRRRNSDFVYRLESYVDKGPLLEKAQKAFAENDFQKAAKVLKRVTILDDHDGAAKLNYASALANIGEQDKALKLLKRVRDVFIDDPEYFMTIAQLHLANHDTDAATGALVDALDAKPDHRPAMDALTKLGILVRIYEDPKDAASLTYVRTDSLLDYLKERWDSEERNSDFYLEQLAYHEGERRYNVALEAAERSIAVADGVLPAGELGRIANLRNMNQPDDALAAAKAYVEKAPESAGAYVELSECLTIKGQTDEARAAVEKALEYDPGYQNALVLRFWPKDDQDIKQVHDAIPELEKFAGEHADVPGVWRSVARAKLVIGAEEAALEMFKKAVALAPDDEDLRGEWWAELAKQTRYQEILDDAEKLGDMPSRHWTLRWNEAEAYRGLAKKMEARGCFMALNGDENLHIDIRKRAKRAVNEMDAPALATKESIAAMGEEAEKEGE